MKIIENLQNGNPVTQRNFFLVSFAIMVIVLAILASYHVISFSPYNNNN